VTKALLTTQQRNRETSTEVERWGWGKESDGDIEKGKRRGKETFITIKLKNTITVLYNPNII
jgi:hypothetical protein